MSQYDWIHSVLLPADIAWANSLQLEIYTNLSWATSVHGFHLHFTHTHTADALIYSPGRNLIKRVPSSQGGKCLAALNHCAVLYIGDKPPSMLNATGLMAWGTIGNPNTGQFSSRFNTCAQSSRGSSGRFKIFFMENELLDTCCRGCTGGKSSRLIDAMVVCECFRAVRCTGVKSGTLARQRDAHLGDTKPVHCCPISAISH